MRKLMIATACALIAAAPAIARNDVQEPQARDNAATGQQPESDGADERRICVTERLSGSRMPRRVCRTAREWQAMDVDNEER